MAIQGIKNIVQQTNPITGTKRGYKEVIETGIDRNSLSPRSRNALKAILGIEGDTVGTTNTQTLTNKTFPEPTSDSSPATKNYVDDKYSQTRYTHNQSTSQNPWAITHNLGYYPDVTIMQSVSGGGSDDYEEVEVHVQHNSVNDLTINLSGATSGKALMR